MTAKRTDASLQTIEPKLADALRFAFRSVVGQWRAAFAVAVLMALIGGLLSLPAYFVALADASAGGAISERPVPLAWLHLNSFLIVLALVPLMTAWHRRVELGHFGVRPGGFLYAVTGRELRYLWTGLLLFALLLGSTVTVAVTVGLAANLAVGDEAALEMLDLLGVVVVLTAIPLQFVLLPRFLVALPAAALGRPLGLAGAYRLTRGRTWTLCAIFLLPFLGFAIVFPLLALPLYGSALEPAAAGGPIDMSEPQVVAALALNFVLGMAFYLFNLAAMSYLHRLRPTDPAGSPG